LYVVERGQLEVSYVKTAENLADFFTKPPAVKTFRAMRDRIMNMQHSLTRTISPELIPGKAATNDILASSL
jgi:hypothetical protein